MSAPMTPERLAEIRAWLAVASLRPDPALTGDLG